MTRLEDRHALVRDIELARSAGARLACACELAGIDPRTLQRWQAGDGCHEVTAAPRSCVLCHRTR
jgi:hypothetical protein